MFGREKEEKDSINAAAPLLSGQEGSQALICGRLGVVYHPDFLRVSWSEFS